MDDITYEESRIETEEEEEIMKEINEQLAGVDNSVEKKETLQPWRDAISTLLRKNNIAVAVKEKARYIRDNLPRLSGSTNRRSRSPQRSRRSRGGRGKGRKNKTRKYRLKYRV
jgi:hypothetical protein